MLSRLVRFRHPAPRIVSIGVSALIATAGMPSPSVAAPPPQAAGDDASKQEAPKEEGKFADLLLAAIRAKDYRRVRQMVVDDRAAAEQAFWLAADKYVSAEMGGGGEASQAHLDVLKNIGNAFYAAKEETEWNSYGEFLQGLDREKKELWNQARDLHVALSQAKDAALASKKPADIDAAIAKGDETVKAFQAINDHMVLGVCWNWIGLLHAAKGDYDPAEEAYKNALSYYQSFGSRSGEDVVKVNIGEVDRARSKAKSNAEKAARGEKVDDKRPDEKGKPGEPGSASDSAWTTVPMSFKVDGEKGIATPSPLCTEEYVLWSRVVVSKSAPAKFSDILANPGQLPETFLGYYSSTTGARQEKDSPLARFDLLFEKGRIFLDKNDNGKGDPEEKLKISTKPSVEQLELPLEGGKTFRYAANIVSLGQEKTFNYDTTFGTKDSAVVTFQRACHMEGDFQGKKIQLIDDSNNGKYDDYGADAVVFGNGPPQILSKVVSIDGKFYELKLADPLGGEVLFREWEGKTGLVGLKWKGTVAPSAVFIREKGPGVSSPVIALDPKSPVKVPVGEYAFYFGIIREGSGRRTEVVEIRQGKSKPFPVKEGETFTLELGAPFEYDFKVTKEREKDKEKFSLRGRDIKIYGKSGEFYTRMYPDFPLPEVEVKREKGGVLAKDKMRFIEQADFNKDISLAWFPRDYDFDPKGQKGKFLYKLTSESKILGKISCDFKDGTGG